MPTPHAGPQHGHWLGSARALQPVATVHLAFLVGTSHVRSCVESAPLRWLMALHSASSACTEQASELTNILEVHLKNPLGNFLGRPGLCDLTVGPPRRTLGRVLCPAVLLGRRGGLAVRVRRVCSLLSAVYRAGVRGRWCPAGQGAKPALLLLLQVLQCGAPPGWRGGPPQRAGRGSSWTHSCTALRGDPRLAGRPGLEWPAGCSQRVLVA